MIPDGELFFEALAGAAITTTRVSTNIVDLSEGRDIGYADYPAPVLVVAVLEAFASATPTATLTIQVRGAPNNAGSPGVYQVFDTSPAIPLGQLVLGVRPYKRPISSISEAPLVPVLANMTTTATSTTATVDVATGILDGMEVIDSPNVVPGTRVATGAGTTTLVLDTAAAVSATLQPTVFVGKFPKPRFLQLNFVASATMTAGKVWAGIVIDTDLPALYRPGFVWPAGA